MIRFLILLTGAAALLLGYVRNEAQVIGPLSGWESFALSAVIASAVTVVKAAWNLIADDIYDNGRGAYVFVLFIATIAIALLHSDDWAPATPPTPVTADTPLDRAPISDANVDGAGQPPSGTAMPAPSAQPDDADQKGAESSEGAKSIEPVTVLGVLGYIVLWVLVIAFNLFILAIIVGFIVAVAQSGGTASPARDNPSGSRLAH